MKIAIKFDEQGDYVSHCTNFSITDLQGVRPSSEGFNFYEVTAEQLMDIHYLKLEGGTVAIDETAKQAEMDKAIKAQELSIKRARLKALSEDIIQAIAGETVPNLQERSREFITLHNEIRESEGKNPREIQEEVL